MTYYPAEQTISLSNQAEFKLSGTWALTRTLVRTNPSSNVSIMWGARYHRTRVIRVATLGSPGARAWGSRFSRQRTSCTRRRPSHCTQGDTMITLNCFDETSLGFLSIVARTVTPGDQRALPAAARSSVQRFAPTVAADVAPCSPSDIANLASSQHPPTRMALCKPPPPCATGWSGSNRRRA